MRRISGVLLMMGMAVSGVSLRAAQSAAGPQAAGLRGSPEDRGAGQPSVAVGDVKSEKKMLAMQTERLFNMATELKAQVDLTNKNILSLRVVQKAEEIEALAKGMRGQAKK